MERFEISNEINIQQQLDIENQIQFEMQEREECVKARIYFLILSIGCFTVAGYTAYYEYLVRYGLR
jgi:hypothetical protein